MEDLLESQLKHEIRVITKRIDVIMENIKELEPAENYESKQGEESLKPIDNV